MANIEQKFYTGKQLTDQQTQEQTHVITKSAHIDEYVNIGSWVAKIFSRVSSGSGVHFESKNSEILKVWQEFNDDNNLDLVVKEIAYVVGQKGSAVITLDKYNDKIRISIADQAWIVRFHETLFGATIWKQIINSNIFYHQIRESWTKDYVRKYFYLRNIPVLIGDFVAQLPAEYREKYNEYYKDRRIDAEGHQYALFKNELGIIPLEQFRLNRRQTPLFDNEIQKHNWNTQINQIITTMQRDVLAAKPRFLYQKADAHILQSLNKTDTPADQVVLYKGSGREELALQVIQSRPIFNELILALNNIVKFVFWYVGLSADVSSQNPTTAAGETKEGGTQYRLIREYKQEFNFTIKKLFLKVLKLRNIQATNKDFNIYLRDNSARDQQELIQNEINAFSNSLISQKTAQEQITQTENPEKVKPNVVGVDTAQNNKQTK